MLVRWSLRAFAARPAPLGTSLTHVDQSGRSQMVDISSKAVTERRATAECLVLLPAHAFDLVRTNSIQKGDVLSVSRMAGVLGSKLTPQLIPLCHPVSLSNVEVRLTLDETRHAIAIAVTASCHGRTGVEMEAMVGASTAALTVYDMVKAVARDAQITGLRLIAKSGGKSGSWTRQEPEPK